MSDIVEKNLSFFSDWLPSNFNRKEEKKERNKNVCAFLFISYILKLHFFTSTTISQLPNEGIFTVAVLTNYSAIFNLRQIPFKSRSMPGLRFVSPTQLRYYFYCRGAVYALVQVNYTARHGIQGMLRESLQASLGTKQ